MPLFSTLKITPEITVLSTLKINRPNIKLPASIKRSSTRNRTSMPSELKNSSKEASTQVEEYVQKTEKLPSIGPLNIHNLDQFLVKSKTDFEKLYNHKDVSNLNISDFKLLKRLGFGAFGIVILAQLMADEAIYAIKVYNKKEILKNKYVRYVSNEKRILQSLNFPFVVYLKHFFVDANFLFFVMPYVPGGNFYKHLHKHKQLSENNAVFYTSQLVLALEYLHYMELIHRDVKPENILIDIFGYLTLADFGQCTRFYGSEDRSWTFTGTPEYMSPAVIKGRGYDCSVDWWSLGVVTFVMCAGCYPFKHKQVNKLYKLILTAKYICPAHFSTQLKSFIQYLLDSGKNNTEHYNKKSPQIKSHPWLNKTDWLALLNRTIPAPFLPDVKDNNY